jgi:hypothetical protein
VSLLAAIDAELSAAQARVAALREIRALAALIDDAPPEVRGGALQDADTAAPGHAAADSDAATQGAAPSAAGTLQRAAATTPARTARPPRVAEAHRPGRNGGDAPETVTAPVAPPSANGAGRAPQLNPGGTMSAVLAALRDGGPQSPRALIERLGTPRTRTYAAIEHLRSAGTITVVEKQGKSRIYGITALADAAEAERSGLRKSNRSQHGSQALNLQRDLLAAVAEQPNGLTELDATAILGAEREHVAVAFGALLEAGDVTLRGDGTYVIAGAT